MAEERLKVFPKTEAMIRHFFPSHCFGLDAINNEIHCESLRYHLGPEYS